MKKLLLMVVALSALIAVPATAADLRRPAPAPVYRPPPPVVPLWTWTGCFFGGHIGGVWASKEWTDATPGFATFGQSVGSHDINGWLGGIQGGCDYQFAGGFVIGIQADYAWVDADSTHVSVLFPNVEFHSNIDSLGSATVRLGYAWDRFLGYVRGGAAWEWDQFHLATVGGVTFAETGLRRRIGWTVGVGGEYAFANWVSAFAEFDYYDFGTRDNRFTTGDIFDIEETKSVVKVGLNFRLGPWVGKAPVAARY
jgi:outer membrane immunogenic protein